MYLSERNRIFELIATIDEALTIIDSGTHFLFEDCVVALDTLYKSLETFNVNFDYSNIKDNKNKLIALKDNLNKQNFISEIEVIRQDLFEFDEFLYNQKVRYRALFLTYQPFTWYSLESIWKAAVNDPDCDPYVVPLPYWDITVDDEYNELNRKFKYNGRKFPKDVPIVNYRNFDIISTKPEMIFINSEYDEKNIFTKIEEKYYSKNLVNNTYMLIYSPYSTPISYNEKSFNNMYYSTEVLKYADKIIVQSQLIKDIYVKHKNDAEKFLTFGSPKTDSVINLMNKPINIPDVWKDKITDKKVFLLNINLNYFIYSYNYAVKEGTYYAVLLINEIIRTFSQRNDCALIFRPHPLLKNYLKNIAPHCLHVLSRLEKYIINSYNCVYDTFANYTNAFMCSHALISMPSSLVSDYMVTKKPVLIFDGYKVKNKTDNKVNKDSPLDYNLCDNNYKLKLTNDEGMTLDEFVEMVLKGEDTKFNDRMEDFNNIFNNLDGTVGEKVYNEIKKGLILK